MTVRVPPDQLERLDGWIERQPEPRPSRPEAIRRLVESALAKPSSAKPRNASYDPGREKHARSMASKAADHEMRGDSASADEKARRRGSLVDEPAVVAKARGKRR